MAEGSGQYKQISGTVPQVLDAPLKFQESSLIASTSASGKINPATQPLTSDDTFSTPSSSTQPSSDGPPSRWGFLSVAFYRPYFDVDTTDVVERLREAVLPFPRSTFLEKTALNPDLYGPFWICATLVFATAALGNLSTYLSYVAYSENDKWHFDINELSWAAAIFYGYCTFVPLGLYFLLRYLQVSVGLVHLWCLYGYSLFVFVPTSFLSVIPLEIIRWIVVLGATCLSSYFLGLNLKAQITTGHELWFPIAIAAVALQGVLGLVLKLYFFTY